MDPLGLYELITWDLRDTAKTYEAEARRKRGKKAVTLMDKAARLWAVSDIREADKEHVIALYPPGFPFERGL